MRSNYKILCCLLVVKIIQSRKNITAIIVINAIVYYFNLVGI